jgi:hypothetical protein
MLPQDFRLNELLELRKTHACGGQVWQVTRLGADIGLRCLQCGRHLMLPRRELERSLRRRLAAGELPGPDGR